MRKLRRNITRTEIIDVRSQRVIIEVKQLQQRNHCKRLAVISDVLLAHHVVLMASKCIIGVYLRLVKRLMDEGSKVGVDHQRSHTLISLPE